MPSPLPDASSSAINTLLDIMAALRNPDEGCPWDLAQSYETIVPYTLEETHEVIEAIETKNMPLLKEELGDLLFQVVFYAQLASEEGLFNFEDIVQGINRKMIRRHPHVFGTPEEKAAVNMEGLWERIKQEEKQETLETEAPSKPDSTSSASTATQAPGVSIPPSPPQLQPVPKSILDGIPPSLPALSRAVKMQNRAASVGFDWPGLDPVFDKMREELGELETEINAWRNQQQETSPPPGGPSAKEALSHIEGEFGDLMFVMANVARHLEIDPEAALRRTNRKFITRFHFIEKALAEQGRTPHDSNLEEMDRLWDQAKQAGL